MTKTEEKLVTYPKVGKVLPEVAEMLEMLDASTGVKRAFAKRCDRLGLDAALKEYQNWMAVAR